MNDLPKRIRELRDHYFSGANGPEYSTLGEAANALEAAAPASAEPVKVKPLAWFMAGHDAVAKSPVGPYEILKAGSFWAIFVNSENTAISRHDSMEDAKEAAQADFEERIRSALA